MRELLRVERRLSLSSSSMMQQQPWSSALQLVDSNSSANIGRAFLEARRLLLLLLTSLTSNPFLLSTLDALTDAFTHASLSAAQHTLALAVAFASNASLLPLAIWLLVDTGVGAFVVIGYAVWCLIFGVSTLAVSFA